MVLPAATLGRSRSPRCKDQYGGRSAHGQVSLQKGQAVQFFLEADPADFEAWYVAVQLDDSTGGVGPRLCQSHGWLNGTLVAAYSPKHFQADKQDTWPLVMPEADLMFVNREGERQHSHEEGWRVPPWVLREASSAPPLLSLVIVHWAGQFAVGSGMEGSGGWGNFGSPPSNSYISALVRFGVMQHSRLSGSSWSWYNFEIFSWFVRDSRDVWGIVPLAPSLAAKLHGKKTTCFWMLWPVEWQDPDMASHDEHPSETLESKPGNTTKLAPATFKRSHPSFWKSSGDFAGYVERQALFSAMRACEGAGIYSAFPHPADLYEVITSKSWIASLALQPQAHLPAAVTVNKSNVIRDPGRAARQALLALNEMRRRRSCYAGHNQTPAFSAANRHSIQKGVVKLGWSWEGHGVLCFTGEEQLAACLTEILTHEGCIASCCYVQEWVEFDFELRLYFLPSGQLSVDQQILPVWSECNRWTGWGDDSKPHRPSPESGVSFQMYSIANCLSCWEQDWVAWRSAQSQAIEVSQYLLAWLMAMDSQPIAMIRLDFMMRRVKPGVARVVFGEFCEMGACCFAWEEGPVKMWHAALDCVLE